jgi:hypothetical protein
LRSQGAKCQRWLTSLFGALAGDSQVAHVESRASPNTGLALTAASGNFIPTSAYNDLITGIVEINDNNHAAPAYRLNL